MKETAVAKAPEARSALTDVHDLDPQTFLEEVHSFEFWFAAVEGWGSVLE
jgi:hypothetical protein